MACTPSLFQWALSFLPYTCNRTVRIHKILCRGVGLNLSIKSENVTEFHDLGNIRLGIEAAGKPLPLYAMDELLIPSVQILSGKSELLLLYLLLITWSVFLLVCTILCEWIISESGIPFTSWKLFFVLVVDSVCKLLVIPRTEKNLELQRKIFRFLSLFPFQYVEITLILLVRNDGALNKTSATGSTELYEFF